MSAVANERYDVVVVGGGPAGTTFAHLARRAGLEVLLVERDCHPRFAIGESLLPASVPIWRRLGVLERLEKAAFVHKFGAYFCFADGAAPEYFHFPHAVRRIADHAYEVPRAEFDRLLWDAALESGLDALDRCEVRRVLFDGERAVGVRLRDADGVEREVAARLVADCSGRATLVGRQRALRERDDAPPKVALYCHYDDVVRSTGADAGTIAIVATDFGWMWLIPFAGGGASLGAVLARDAFGARRKAGLGLEAIWDEAVAATPAVARRLAGARRVRPVEAAADFQYRLREVAGPGWVAVGDAGAFLDPIFSSGVHLAMAGAETAADDAVRALADGRRPEARDFARHVRASRNAFDVYARFIRAWYDPAFRDVFIHPPPGRPGVGRLKREIGSVLAGAVAPGWRVRPVIALMLWIAGRRRRALAAQAREA